MVITKKARNARAAVLNTRLSQRILSLCEERGMSQRQLALQAGLDPSYVSRIIGGKTEPGIVTLAALGEVFGLTLAKFFDGIG